MYFTGGQPSAISPDGQTLTYQVKVSDYDNADFAVDANQPTVDVQKVSDSNFPTAGSIIQDDQSIIGNITIKAALELFASSGDMQSSVKKLLRWKQY